MRWMEKREAPEKTGRKARGTPRKMTRERVLNIARFHMERYSCTADHLKRVLTRRVDRALKVHGGDRAAALEWVDAAVQALQRAGVLNDARFALALATALRRKGRTPARIQMALRAKGVPRDQIAEALRESAGPGDEGDAYAGALAYIRRRRLGPFRPKDRIKSDPQEARRLAQKDLAAVVRAGFSLDIARRVLAAEI